MPADRDPVALSAVPAASRIAGLYADPDLADAFEIALPVGASDDPETLARFIFLNQAPWVGRAMRVRDRVMARFGVKTATQLRGTGDRRIAIFRIFARSHDEIVLGEDDRHLDFRVSVLRTTSGSPGVVQARLVLSTVVRCHNRLGRTYLWLITPFHRMVVRSGPATRGADRLAADGVGCRIDALMRVRCLPRE